MPRKILIYLSVLLGIVAFAGLFIILFGNSTEIYCVRAADGYPACRITKVLLGKVPVSTRTITDVTDVQLDESCDDGCSYRAVLVSANGRSTPVNDVYTDRGPVLEQIDGMRDFLEGTASSYQRVEPVPWWVVALTGGMAIVGMVLLALNFVREARQA
jgi:hypothetical protein